MFQAQVIASTKATKKELGMFREKRKKNNRPMYVEYSLEWVLASTEGMLQMIMMLGIGWEEERGRAVDISGIDFGGSPLKSKCVILIFVFTFVYFNFHLCQVICQSPQCHYAFHNSFVSEVCSTLIPNLSLG